MIKKITLTLLTIVSLFLSSFGIAAADINCVGGSISPKPASGAQYCCGRSVQGQSNAIATSINFGCEGKGNPIIDMTFAFINLLSDGVGLVIIASLTVAGIQFTTSRGDPQATAKSVHRLQANVTALVVFFFAYAILNYVVPGAVLQ